MKVLNENVRESSLQSSVLGHRPSAPHPRACFGLLKRKERWGLSWRGRLAVAVFLAAAFFIAVPRTHSFLAVTQRTDTDILVVEGWINQFAVRAAAKTFKDGSYRLVFATGGPVNFSGRYINDQNTGAGITADGLIQAGVPADAVRMAPSQVIGRDRTYSSAAALRNWFHDHNMPVRSFNVLTEDAHARRTRLLYQEAFGKDVKVGVISLPSPDYDADHWWRYSEGVRGVVDETVAYLYAKLFFWPETPR
jgi:hypothetical protein